MGRKSWAEGGGPRDAWVEEGPSRSPITNKTSSPTRRSGHAQLIDRHAKEGLLRPAERSRTDLPGKYLGCITRCPQLCYGTPLSMPSNGSSGPLLVPEKRAAVMLSISRRRVSGRRKQHIT
ncbi:hypothetical protein Salat_2045700 [Sesamum alatum]|uniref:Uncharacterized protein n=1 Tax=Sesamum alatum TaxID=300844 RepID=A0AAE1XZT5_9LAMI|nr:hypothetical protein Salat_2045700 [Sesamum alatum]